MPPHILRAMASRLWERYTDVRNRQLDGEFGRSKSAAALVMTALRTYQQFVTRHSLDYPLS